MSDECCFWQIFAYTALTVCGLAIVMVVTDVVLELLHRWKERAERRARTLAESVDELE